VNRDVKYWLVLFGVLALTAAVVVRIAERRIDRRDLVGGYERVQIGMTIEEVEAELGRPDSLIGNLGMIYLDWDGPRCHVSVTLFGESKSVSHKSITRRIRR